MDQDTKYGNPRTAEQRGAVREPGAQSFFGVRVCLQSLKSRRQALMYRHVLLINAKCALEQQDRLCRVALLQSEIAHVYRCFQMTGLQ